MSDRQTPSSNKNRLGSGIVVRPKKSALIAESEISNRTIVTKSQTIATYERSGSTAKWLTDSLENGTLRYSRSQDKTLNGFSSSKIKGIQEAGLDKLECQEWILDASGFIVSGNHRAKALIGFSDTIEDFPIRVTVLAEGTSADSIREISNRENRAVSNPQTCSQILNALDSRTKVLSIFREALKKHKNLSVVLDNDVMSRINIVVAQAPLVVDLDPCVFYGLKPSSFMDTSGSLSLPPKTKDFNSADAQEKVRALIEMLASIVDCAASNAATKQTVLPLLKKQSVKQSLICALWGAKVDPNQTPRMRNHTGGKLRAGDVVQNMVENAPRIRELAKGYSASVRSSGPTLKSIYLRGE